MRTLQHVAYRGMGTGMTRIDLQIRPASDDVTVLGSGFLALDVVEGQYGQFATAGGSCGNVLTMLAWLGWSSAPVARLGDDLAGQYVCEDLEAFDVDLRHIQLATSVRTPIVFQRFQEDTSGQRRHRFSLVCPDCGAWLPRFRSVVLVHAAQVMVEAPPRAFYFDRVSPAIVRLAEWVRSESGLVVFEPSSMGDEALFRRAIDACHVLKYSDERLGHLADLADTRQPALIVRTCGSDGLRARWQGRWRTQSAFHVTRVVDAAGSGDWCTAGLMHMIGQSGSEAFLALSAGEIERGLRVGQALASLNCAYEGARGLMLATQGLDSVNLMLRDVAGGSSVVRPGAISIDSFHRQPEVCHLCSGDAPTKQAKTSKRPRASR